MALAPHKAVVMTDVIRHAPRVGIRFIPRDAGSMTRDARGRASLGRSIIYVSINLGHMCHDRSAVRSEGRVATLELDTDRQSKTLLGCDVDEAKTLSKLSCWDLQISRAGNC